MSERRPPQSSTGSDERGSELPWTEWAATISTLHMWTQIVGKVRMALAPPLNHWWHVPLYVSGRGLTTSAIPYGLREFQVNFDFIDHRLQVVASDGASLTMPLEPKSVAHFYREFMDGLRALGIEVRIWARPTEVAEAIPFESDELHATYDPRHAQLFWRGLLQADRVLKAFQSGFVGKVSPVHFFWGSFDLAAARFSGPPAPRHPGGTPNVAAWVDEEAYSWEISSAGWWPHSEAPVLRSTPTRTPSRRGSGPRRSVRRRRFSMRGSATSSCRRMPFATAAIRMRPCWSSSSQPMQLAPTSEAGTDRCWSRRSVPIDRPVGHGARL